MKSRCHATYLHQSGHNLDVLIHVVLLYSFLTDTKYYWLGCTKLPCNFAITKGLWLLYCAQMGYYLQVPSCVCAAT